MPCEGRAERPRIPAAQQQDDASNNAFLDCLRQHTSSSILPSPMASRSQSKAKQKSRAPSGQTTANDHVPPIARLLTRWPGEAMAALRETIFLHRDGYPLRQSSPRAQHLPGPASTIAQAATRLRRSHRCAGSTSASVRFASPSASGSARPAAMAMPTSAGKCGACIRRITLARCRSTVFTLIPS